MFAATPVFLHQPGIGKLQLGILIEKLHVGVRGCGIEIEVVFLYVFSVVTFISSEPEQTFFQDGIVAVPKGQSKADQLMPIANAAQAVLPPTVGPRSRM